MSYKRYTFSENYCGKFSTVAALGNSEVPKFRLNNDKKKRKILLVLTVFCWFSTGRQSEGQTLKSVGTRTHIPHQNYAYVRQRISHTYTKRFNVTFLGPPGWASTRLTWCQQCSSRTLTNQLFAPRSIQRIHDVMGGAAERRSPSKSDFIKYQPSLNTAM